MKTGRVSRACSAGSRRWPLSARQAQAHRSALTRQAIGLLDQAHDRVEKGLEVMRRRVDAAAMQHGQVAVAGH